MENSVVIRLLFELLYINLFLIVIPIVLFKFAQRADPIDQEEDTDETSDSHGILISGKQIIFTIGIGIIAIVFVVALLGDRWIAVPFLAFTLFHIHFWISNLMAEGKIPWLANKESKNVTIIQAIITLILGSSWLVSPSWVTYDFVFIIAVYNTIRLYNDVRFRTIFICSILIMVFDIWGVTLSHVISDFVLNSAIFPPSLLIVPINPANLSVNTTDIAAILGFGDVILAGIAISTAERFKLGNAATVGFALGVVITLMISFVVNDAIPATVPILPSIFGAIFIWHAVQKKRGKLSSSFREILWHG